MGIEVLAPDSNGYHWEISEVADCFHVTCVEPLSNLRGSGSHRARAVAKKKAFAELNERHLVTQIAQLDQCRADWGLDYDSSCSGFAVGYDRDATLLRATLEAMERWALSKWIDDHHLLPMEAAFPKTPLRREVHGFFLNFDFYGIRIPLVIGNGVLGVYLSVFLGWTEEGVFAGYGAKTDADEAIDHAHIEAYRNFVIHKNQKPREHFPYNRISYFAKNKSSAQKAIAGCTKETWPAPRVRLSRAEQFGEIWLARVIMNDWIPWQLGSIRRFLY